MPKHCSDSCPLVARGFVSSPLLPWEVMLLVKTPRILGVVDFRPSHHQLPLSPWEPWRPGRWQQPPTELARLDGLDGPMGPGLALPICSPGVSALWTMSWTASRACSTPFEEFQVLRGKSSRPSETP